MRLQSLELFGFKSFADKTVFNFHEGVTAIVWPNGCGKSNVLDAVRWTLGEQSAKSLRGEEMADVIFSGSEKRKPVGFAQVSLTFTDCAAELGIDWHDVQVTRRVYRDGNSEYFLNKTACRLRDIQSLFADTGVARTAYSMMKQGRIDMILSSRAEMQRLESEIAAHRSRIEFNCQRAEELAELIERAQSDIADAETKREQHAADIEQINNSIAEIERHLKDKDAELTKLTSFTGE